MAGVGGLSSLGLFLLLLLASSSAAREERSTRQGWQPVSKLTDIKFLVLLEYTEGTSTAYCSGSIISPSTVLTYCTKDPNMAYAGLLDVAEKNNAQQKRKVAKVEPHSDELSALKICILKEKWELNSDVAVVKLPPTAPSRDLTSCTLLGFGMTPGKAQMLGGQKLGNKECSAVATAGELDSRVLAAELDTKQLTDKDLGGPAVCGTEQRGINKLHKEATRADGCNVFVDVAHFIPWIEEQKQAAEEAGASGGTGGTGGNGTSPSSGYSIHSHLNKYSNWKVLGFITSAIVIFLQY